MESNPGATLRAHGVRPLGLPRPLTVHVDARGEPLAVTLHGGRDDGGRDDGGHGERHVVERVEEVWRIAEAWWREAPIRRTYYRVLIEGGRPLTLFRDDASTGDASTGDASTGKHSEAGAAWYEQRY